MRGRQLSHGGNKGPGCHWFLKRTNILHYGYVFLSLLKSKDVLSSEISVGSIVELINAEDEKVTYTILGPWDADPDQNILSFQSKLAETMLGLKKGDKLSFKDEEYTVQDIRSYLSESQDI